MIQQPPGSGLLLPALHCASIALELYLKSLSARELEIRDVLVGGAYIYAQSAASIHALEDLFDMAPADIRQLIEHEVGQSIRLRFFGSARSALGAHNSMFMASRYPFEASSELQDVKIEALDDLLQVLDKVIRQVPHRWVTDPP